MLRVWTFNLNRNICSVFTDSPVRSDVSTTMKRRLKTPRTRQNACREALYVSRGWLSMCQHNLEKRGRGHWIDRRTHKDIKLFTDSSLYISIVIPSSEGNIPGSFSSLCNKFSKSAQSQPISSGNIGMLKGCPEKGCRTPPSMCKSTGFKMEESDGSSD